MQCFILNSSLAYENPVEGIISFRWTERFTEPNDFEIVLPYTSTNASRLREDVVLMIADSPEPMIIETVKIKKSGKSKQYIVSGRDLTSWLEMRVAPWDNQIDATRVSDIAKTVLTKAIISPAAPQDKFPNVSGVTNVANDGAKFDYESTNDDLLSDLQNILNDNNCAIACDRIGSLGSYSWRYRIYSGRNRTINFSDKDGTLVDTQYIRSRKKWRTHANVRYKTSNKEDATTLSRMVYANGGSSSQSGLSRRSIRVDATNLNPNDYPGSRFNTALDRLGRAALAKQLKIEAIDGEVPAYAPATYRKDYFLGDVVKFGSDATTTTKARVTQFTWSIDSSGFKAQPTIDVTADISV